MLRLCVDVCCVVNFLFLMCCCCWIFFDALFCFNKLALDGFETSVRQRKAKEGKQRERGGIQFCEEGRKDDRRKEEAEMLR